MRGLKVVVALIGCGVLVGCATGQRVSSRSPSKNQEFPSRSELAAVAKAPLPADIFQGQEDLDPKEWELEGPFPGDLGHKRHRYRDPWGRALEAHVDARPGTHFTSEVMACAARELGRFRLSQGNHPSLLLRKYIAARCGALEALDARWLQSEVDETLSDEAIFAQWEASYEEMIKKALAGGGGSSVGVWYGRAKGRAVVLIATAERKVHLESIEFEAEEALIRGEILLPSAKVNALVNHGAVGFRRCTNEPNVSLPFFVFRCELNPEDSEVWLDVYATAPGRFLGNRVMQTLLVPQGNAPAIYRRKEAPEEALAMNLSVEEQFIEGLNRIRSLNDLQPLNLATAQSQVVEQVAPYYFAAGSADIPDFVADIVVHGLLAGWEIGDMVKDSHFTSATTSGQANAGDLLVLSLSYPLGRAALLDGEATELALGLVTSETGQGLFITTYELLELDPAKGTKLLRDRVASIRHENGLQKTYWLSSLAPIASEAAARIEAGSSPDGELNDLLEEGARHLSGRVRGWWLTTDSLEEVQLPKELLEEEGLGLVLSVGRYRDDDNPWGRYVVLVLMAKVEGKA